MAQKKADDGGGRNPPYISYATFRTFMQNVKDHGVPAQIDRSVLGNFAGSVGAQLQTGLKFLGLIEPGGKTTPRLIQLRDAFGTPAWGTALGTMLKEAYKNVMSVDLKTATPRMLEDAFATNYDAQGSVRRKVVTFFVHAVKDAGLSLSPHVSNKTRRTGKRSPRAPRAKTDAGRVVPFTSIPAGQSATNGKTPAQVIYEIFDPTKMSEQERAAVFTLLTYLKKAEIGK